MGVNAHPPTLQPHGGQQHYTHKFEVQNPISLSTCRDQTIGRVACHRVTLCFILAPLQARMRVHAGRIACLHSSQMLINRR